MDNGDSFYARLGIEPPRKPMTIGEVMADNDRRVREAAEFLAAVEAKHAGCTHSMCTGSRIGKAL